MDAIDRLPDRGLDDRGPLSRRFMAEGLGTFIQACRHVHRMPYGYNRNKDDPLIVFKKGFGSCTTKHMAVGLLAREMGLPVGKGIGIYPMTDRLVSGADHLCSEFGLAAIPVVHCFLVYDRFRVDLTEGNLNGKNGFIDDFLVTFRLPPDISSRNEYFLCRQAPQGEVLTWPDWAGVTLKTIPAARGKALVLLKANVRRQQAAA